MLQLESFLAACLIGLSALVPCFVFAAQVIDGNVKLCIVVYMCNSCVYCLCAILRCLVVTGNWSCNVARASDL